MTLYSLSLGATPSDEPCAQLGRTPSFDRYASLETMVYRAALIAAYGPPPEGSALKVRWQNHDFGRYPDLVLEYDPNAGAHALYAAAIDRGLRTWSSAGFHAPVLYDDASAVREVVFQSHFEAARRVIIMLERLRIDGFGSPYEALGLAHLRAAYPAEAVAADAMLRQLAGERSVRSDRERQVTLFAPYQIIWMPAAFNEYRGALYPKGDCWDVAARERRPGHRCVVVDIGSCPTLDQAIDACWEHLARYVVR